MIISPRFLLLIALLPLAFATACLSEEEEDIKEGKEKLWKPPSEEQAPKLIAQYIGGTLGSYDACPDQAYMGTSDSGGAKRGGPESGDIACEPGSRCGNFAPSCDPAQVSLDLENQGLGDAKEISVQSIELIDQHGQSLASLPLIDVQNILTMKAFDGRIAAKNNKKSLRIRFQGPYNPDALRRDYANDAPPSTGAGAPCQLGVDGCGGYTGSDYFKIRVTFSIANHPDVVVESRAIYTSPDIAT